MSYYGDLEDYYNEVQDILDKYSTKELRAIYKAGPEHYPEEFKRKRICDFYLEDRLGLRKRVKPNYAALREYEEGWG